MSNVRVGDSGMACWTTSANWGEAPALSRTTCDVTANVLVTFETEVCV